MLSQIQQARPRRALGCLIMHFFTTCNMIWNMFQSGGTENSKMSVLEQSATLPPELQIHIREMMPLRDRQRFYNAGPSMPSFDPQLPKHMDQEIRRRMEYVVSTMDVGMGLDPDYMLKFIEYKLPDPLVFLSHFAEAFYKKLRTYYTTKKARELGEKNVNSAISTKLSMDLTDIFVTMTEPIYDDNQLFQRSTFYKACTIYNYLDKRHLELTIVEDDEDEDDEEYCECCGNVGCTIDRAIKSANDRIWNENHWTEVDSRIDHLEELLDDDAWDENVWDYDLMRKIVTKYCASC